MKHSWSVLFLSILAVLHLTSSVSYCDDCLQITVDDTIYKTPLGEYFEIKCYIISTEQLSNNVAWYKLEGDKFVPVTVDSHIEIKSEKLSNVTTMLLCFTNIQQSNAGYYRCESGSAVGHTINVSVYGMSLYGPEFRLLQTLHTTFAFPDNDIMADISLRNDTTMSKEEIRWMYVYSAAGTIAFVVMVIFVSIISLRRCKAKQRPTTKCANPLRQLHLQRDERRRRKALKNKQQSERRQIRHVCHSRPPAACRRRRRYSRETEEASRRKFTLCRYTTGRSAMTHDVMKVTFHLHSSEGNDSFHISFLSHPKWQSWFWTNERLSHSIGGGSLLPPQQQRLIVLFDCYDERKVKKQVHSWV
ncbi:uncharacterized protein LOC119119732 isoform X2 [Syngnathus acus]|uniref:uncharacterized protein LOC119119732 isoform X2 n=1 Tax=Syngnathus acus TaxID=161584 RepID=UPI0018863E65|nr:uncharacterized protein LOC119119732 isoform X2 [Syngnathus acus]